MPKTVFRDVRLTGADTERDTKGICRQTRTRAMAGKTLMKHIGKAIKAGHAVQMDTYYGADGHEYANAVITRE